MLSESNEIAELISRFKRDIVYDAHSFWLRYNRSRARKALEELGREALGPIAVHLKENSPDDFMRLDAAWGILLAEIAGKIGEKPDPVPEPEDTQKWIEWAETHAQ